MKPFVCSVLALLFTAICARAVPVTLRVVDANNQPVAGVSVQVADFADATAAKPADAATSAQTAADGTLALDLRGVSNDAGEGASEFAIRADDGRALGGARVRDARFGFGIVQLFAGENTLKLRPGVRVRGVVKNAADEPLAGARVKFVSAERKEGDYSNGRVQFGLPAIMATTDAKGRWEIADLPRGYARFAVSSPGAAGEELAFRVDNAETVAPAAKLRASGVIRGRVLDFRGAPLAGVSVDLYDEHAESVRTDAQGRFELPGVAVGEREVTFYSSAPDWFGVAGEIKATIPAQGAVVDIGDVRGDAGVLLSGTTVEGKSRVPVPNVPLGIFGSGQNLRTDARGDFEMRVRRPFFQLSVGGDYLQNWGMLNVPIEADKFDLGELEVKRATRLPLDLRDEAGNVVPDAQVSFVKKVGDSRYQTNSVRDARGAISALLSDGQYDIEGAGLWEAIAPQKLTVAPAFAGQYVEPLRVRVRRAAPIRVAGRVVDGAGAPLAEVEVKVKTLAGWSGRAAISDANGSWTVELPTAQGEPIFEAADLWPFALVRGGEMTREGASNNWKSTDIMMARTDVALTGRVANADGAAVAGARVGWLGDPKSEFVATDAAGNFVIENVPSATLTIMASDGPRFAQAITSPGAPVALRLPPAMASLSSVQLEELWQQSDPVNLWNLSSYFDVLGAARVYQTARRLDAGGNPARIGDGISTYLSMRADRARTPAESFDAALEGVELLRPIAMGDVNGEGAAKIAVLAARTDDAELRAWAASWYDSRKPRVPDKLDPSYYSDSNLLNTELRMSAVGAALGRDDADKYRADALTLMRNYSNGEPRFYMAGWGELLWMADAKRFDQAISSWSKTEQMAFIAGALKRVGDAAAAKSLWSWLESLGDDTEVLAAEKSEMSGSWSQRRERLQEGRLNYARAVALADMPSALSALENVGNSPDACAIALVIARAARAEGRTEIAKRALNVGLTGNYGNTTGTLALAMEARDFDAPLAEQLLSRFRESALTDEAARAEKDRGQGWRQVAAYAIALSEFDAGAGRLLLEDQWAKRRNTSPAVGGDYESWHAIEQQQSLAIAMAIYDLPRALQWLSEIKDERDRYNNKLEATRATLFAFALAKPEQRPDVLSASYFN